MEKLLDRWAFALSRGVAPILPRTMSPTDQDPYASQRRYQDTLKGKEAHRAAQKRYREARKEALLEADRARTLTPARRAYNAHKSQQRRDRIKGQTTLVALYYCGPLWSALCETLESLGAESLIKPLDNNDLIIWIWWNSRYRDLRKSTPTSNPRSRVSKLDLKTSTTED
jgi:hypothetical protein